MSYRVNGLFCRYARLFNVSMIIVLVVFSIVVLYIYPQEISSASWVTYLYVFIIALFVISIIAYAMCFLRGRLGK